MTTGVHAELSADGRRIVLAFTGDDYELDAAARALKRLTALTEPTSPPSGMRTAPATWATVTQLAHTFSSDSAGRWLPRPRLREWITAEFLRRCDPGRLAYRGLRPGLVPRPYQVEAAAMIGAMGRVLIFDSPGVGKTAEAILGLLERQARGHEIFPLLIVTPSWSINDVFARHIAQWAPGWPEPAMYGGAERSTDAKVLLSTYATLRIDAADANGPLVRLAPAAVVLDEATALKGNSTRQSLAARRVCARAGTVVVMTGTPVVKDAGDVYPLLAAVDPRSYPSRERFVKRYCLTSDSGYGETVDGLDPLAEPEFRAALAGQYRRVSREDVLSQLPPKIYSVRRVEIPPAWRKSYDAMRDDMLAELPDGSEVGVMSALAQLTRLSQLASSACDVAVTEERDEQTGELRKHYEVTLRAPSWKVDALLEILAERPDDPVAVFAPSRQLIALATAAAAREGYRCGLVTGGETSASRRRDIDAFQAGELDLILCTAGAGGLGITLDAAGAAVFLQRPWSLAESIQCEDRLMRTGQRHGTVEIIDVVARGTVDETVRAALRGKAASLAEMLADPRIVREILGGLK